LQRTTLPQDEQRLLRKFRRLLVIYYFIYSIKVNQNADWLAISSIIFK